MILALAIKSLRNRRLTAAHRLGQQIVIAHGAGDVAFVLHSDHPFRVVGILARTGTPVDRAIHASLEGMDAVHSDHSAGDDPLAAAMRPRGQATDSVFTAATTITKNVPSTPPVRRSGRLRPFWSGSSPAIKPCSCRGR